MTLRFAAGRACSVPGGERASQGAPNIYICMYVYIYILCMYTSASKFAQTPPSLRLSCV